MLKAIKQIRAAASLLSPDQIRRLAAEPPDIGLVASSTSGYTAMEDFLIPAAVPHRERLALMQKVHRAGDAGVPDKFDLVLFEHGVACPSNCFVFRRDDPGATVQEILREREELGLALARHYLPFRKAVTDTLIHTVSRENALFAVATALPNIIPSLIELPWAMGEFASDTAFITLNQVRMAFLIAAASGKTVGFSEQKVEIASIIGGAFGWRALARELAGKIPLGAGLIPKGAIAFAGTFVIGKGLQRLHDGLPRLTPAERRVTYEDGYSKGRAIVESAERSAPPA